MDASPEEEVTRVIADATRKAALDLFAKYPGNYYYFSLVSTGDGSPCCVTAWSHEALAKCGDPDLKWSCADSPYYAYGWDEFFGEVKAAFVRRPAISSHPQAVGEEFEFRYRCMEEALRTLDREGIFGRGNVRNNIVVNVEVMPPDRTNIERARRLNPPESLKDWLSEAAEWGDRAT